MPIINFTQPFSIFVGVVLFVLMLFLAKENKKAWIIGTVLFAFIGLLVGHTVEPPPPPPARPAPPPDTPPAPTSQNTNPKY